MIMIATIEGQFNTSQGQFNNSPAILLDAERKSQRVEEFEEKLSVGAKFVLQCSDGAKEMLLKEGLDFRYGARHIKRSIERFLVYPLSGLIATGQMQSGDVVHVDVNRETGKLAFMKYAGGSLIDGTLQRASRVMSKGIRSRGVALSFSRMKDACNEQKSPAA